MGAGNCYQLTQQGRAFSVGNVWANRTIDLTQDFDFTFIVNQCGGADAVVFVLQNSGATATIGADGVGANLGYYLSRTGVFAQSVAIELDIFQNYVAPYNDPIQPHLMLALNGNPAAVEGPVVVPALNDCADHRLRIIWQQATNLLTVQLDGVTRLRHVQDLVATVFGGKPRVWFGFTASTGGQTATQSICPVSLTASPQTLPLSAQGFEGSASICPGRSVQLSVSEYAAGSTFQWSPAAGLSTNTGALVTASPAATTTYTVTGRAPGGCEQTGQITVTVIGPLSLSVTPPRLSAAGEVVLTASGGGEGATYQWSPSAGLSATEGPTVTARPPAAATTYTVTATSAMGCTGQTTVVVPPFVLPNIITPNGDRRNDTFRPLVSLEPVMLQVYTRWGQPVFEQANYQSDWGAEQLAAGSYYYRLSTAGGESWKGWVEVVR